MQSEVTARESLLSEANISAALLALAMGLLPLSVSLNVGAVALLVLHTLGRRLAAGDWRQRWSSLRSRRMVWALFAYLAWTALSLLWTSNLPHGMQDLVTFAPLGLVPAAVAFGPALSAAQRRSVFVAFALGTWLTVAIGFAEAWPLYRASGDVGQLFYHNLTTQRNIHAIFLAHYVATALLLLVPEALTSRGGQRVALWGLAAALLPALVLLASRMTLAAFAGVGLVGGLWALRQANWAPRNLRLMRGFVAATVALLILAVGAVPQVRQRFADLWEKGWEYTWQNPAQLWVENPPNEFSMRIIAWRHSLSALTQENAWLHGVGTGDAQDALCWQWFESNLWMYYLYHNAHNQYVQTLLGVGLIGLTLLLWALLEAWHATRGRWAARLWLSFVGLVMLTESELVRQHGVMFVALGLALLVSAPAEGSGEQDARHSPDKAAVGV